jgi:hypothetical protein
MIEDTNISSGRILLGDVKSVGISVAACCNVCDAQSSYPGPFVALVFVDSYPAESWKIVPPQEARKFAFASKLSRKSNLYLASITIPQFHPLQILGDSGLRNGLCKEIHGNYDLGCGLPFPGSDDH